MRRYLRRAAAWIVAPYPSRWHVLLPVGYMALVQFLVGVPDPSYFVAEPDEGAAHLVRSVSSVIFLAPSGVRNLAHIPLFGTMAWLWCQALESWVASLRRAVVLAGVLVGVYAFLSEWIQSFIPTRFASAMDLAYNWFGVVVAASVYLAVRTISRESS